MITDRQVRKLRQLDRRGLAKEAAALRVGIDAKSARKYRRLGKLPSEVMSMDRNWRTHPDVFAEVWPEREAKLQLSPRLQAKTLFADLQRRFPDRFADGQETHGNGANVDDLETHEERQVLPRACFSVEPGIYLPDFGVRSEVNVFIDANRQVHVTGGSLQTAVVPMLKAYGSIPLRWLGKKGRSGDGPTR